MKDSDLAQQPINTLIHSKEINIATAGNRMAKKWANKSITVQQLVGRLGKTVRTHETIEEYRGMAKADQDNIKDIGGYVAATLKGGLRRKSSVANRQLLTYDIDFGTPKTVERVKKVLANYAFTISSTHKHTPAHPRFRLIVYPDRPMHNDEFVAVARKIASSIDIEVFDEGSYELNRLLFWPSSSSDSEFLFFHNDAPFLPVDKVLAQYGPNDEWKDTSLWPQSSRETKSFDRMLSKQADPLLKKGIVGAFSRTVSIHDALDVYLKDVYKKEREDRYTYIEGSSTNGLVIYSGKYAYSNHNTDPCCGQLCNSFDLIRLHLHGHLDEKSQAVGTKLPSYKEMVEWARGIDGVKADLVKSGMEIDVEAFDEFDDPDRVVEDWEGKLQTNESGLIKPTLVNGIMILRNDPEVKDRMRFNTFSLLEERADKGTNWDSHDSLQLRDYVGLRYQVDFPEKKVADAIEARAFESQYHPVRDYLYGVRWDGVPRCEKLFIDYFGCGDNPYTREVGLCWTTAAVKRVMEPGCKFDYTPVISGAQGIGKTRFVRTLAGGPWYGELSSFDPQIAVEEMTGKWLMEINEMGATNKRELEEQKSFLSACSTRVRLSYRRNARDYMRQCVFIGTTNLPEYLKDSTGNRRWWPIDVAVEAVDIERLKVERDQIWAEAVLLYAQGRNIFLSKDAETIAIEIQEGKVEIDEWIGIISEWLDTEAYEDRYATRLGSTGGNLGHRDRVCIIEIWEDCLEIINRPPKPVERKRITGILDNMEGWKRKKTKDGLGVSTMKFGRRFGAQKGWINDVPF